MSIFNDLLAGISLWVKYGKTFSAFLNAGKQVTDLDDGQLLSKINTIFKNNGFDFSKIFTTLDTPNFSNISTIQTALNDLGYKCAVTSYLDNDTLGAVKAFQLASSLSVDGVPGQQTVTALSAAVTANHLVLSPTL